MAAHCFVSSQRPGPLWAFVARCRALRPGDYHGAPANADQALRAAMVTRRGGERKPKPAIGAQIGKTAALRPVETQRVTPSQSMGASSGIYAFLRRFGEAVAVSLRHGLFRCLSRAQIAADALNVRPNRPFAHPDGFAGSFPGRPVGWCVGHQAAAAAVAGVAGF